MTAETVEHVDLELWLCGRLRPALTTWAPLVDRRFPAPSWVPGFAVVVRDDSGPDQSMVTAARSVGVTVIGPDGTHQQTAQLAQRVAALLRLSYEPPSPVATCERVRGPYSLAAVGRVEFYLSADLVVVGQSVTL